LSRDLLVGLAISGLIVAVIWYLTMRNSMTPKEAAFYDRCLSQNGNIAACDAMIRVIRNKY
jgi:hypothetical protein